MLNDLPKLFDRDFTIGYVLPSVSFWLYLLALVRAFNITQIYDALTIENEVLGTAIVIVLIWVGAAFLIVVNYELYRWFEGYGRFNPYLLMKRLPFRKWFPRQVDIFKRLQKTVETVSSKDTTTEREKEQLQSARLDLAEKFPSDVGDLQSTAFGNAIKSFEMYSADMYGFEATRGWERLRAVIPKDYLEGSNSAKAITDFWLNLWFISLLYIIVYASLAVLFWINGTDFDHSFNVTLLGALTLAQFASWRATSAAVGWGLTIRAAMDVYLPKLGESLGLGSHPSREQWRSYSIKTLYRVTDDANKETSDRTIILDPDDG